MDHCVWAMAAIGGYSNHPSRSLFNLLACWEALCKIWLSQRFLTKSRWLLLYNQRALVQLLCLLLDVLVSRTVFRDGHRHQSQAFFGREGSYLSLQRQMETVINKQHALSNERIKTQFCDCHLNFAYQLDDKTTKKKILSTLETKKKLIQIENLPLFWSRLIRKHFTEPPQRPLKRLPNPQRYQH